VDSDISDFNRLSRRFAHVYNSFNYRPKLKSSSLLLAKQQKQQKQWDKIILDNKRLLRFGKLNWSAIPEKSTSRAQGYQDQDAADFYHSCGHFHVSHSFGCRKVYDNSNGQ